MKKIAAIFDVDGTLIAGNITHYYQFYLKHYLSGWKRWIRLSAFYARFPYWGILDQINRSQFNISFYKVYKNFPLNLKDDFSKRCFEEYIYPHLFQEMLDRIAWHRSQNHHIILVSGSLKFILKPLADFIQANALLCPDIQAEENRLNGILTQSPVIGSEKAKLFLEYHQTHHFELNESYSYADSTSDIPILELVGNAFVINPNKKLKKISSLRGWQSLEVSQHPQSHPFYSGASHEF